MRLLYVADGRSPIALSWISYFIDNGHEVHLASSFPCQPMAGLASFEIIPIAMSGSLDPTESGGGKRISLFRRIVPANYRTLIRRYAAPYTFPRAADALEQVIGRIQPELVHAMRIPYEGMVASVVMERIEKRNAVKPPLVISVWGNDFTLHAKATPAMLGYTQQALKLADGLHCDCHRDQRLAEQLGYEASRPQVLVPCAGGVRLDTFFPAGGTSPMGSQEMGENNPVTVINPRGFRAYVRNDTFFHAIPAVVEKFPKARFICPGMKGEARAEKWLEEIGMGEKVELLPNQTRQQMAELFRRSEITLSITTHDGTPNTLVEALACGCFPIAGDIESLREWITTGENGLLVDPSDPTALAEAMIKAISHPEMRAAAGERNLQLVRERAEYGRCMQMVEELYRQVLGTRQSGISIEKNTRYRVSGNKV